VNPIFLSLGEIIEIHRDQINRYGGMSGIRDIGLLKSALAMPSAGFGECYVHNDLFEMAAAYLFHIIRNHPFVDGNKRTGTVAAVIFLDINGIELNVNEQIFEEMVISVAEGKASKSSVANFFRNNSLKTKNSTF
jgi:death-on-curing protein